MKSTRKGCTYRYLPTFGDYYFNHDLKSGELVKVVELPGAPRRSMRGWSHVVAVADENRRGFVKNLSLESGRSNVHSTATFESE